MNTILGSMRQIDDKRGAVRVENVYDTDIADLWSAVTDPERLARWIATVEGDLRVGADIHARFTSTWEGPIRIDECEAPHHLVVRLDPGTDDETVIEAVLTTRGDQTHLAVEERGLPLDVLDKHGAGWQAHIEDLARALDGKDSRWRERWGELAPAYATLVVS